MEYLYTGPGGYHPMLGQLEPGVTKLTDEQLGSLKPEFAQFLQPVGAPQPEEKVR